MSPYLPGHPPRPPLSLVPPLLQLGLGIGLLGLAWWAYEHAQVARATDIWAFNGLSAISALAGVLWLPFAVSALAVVLRNRRRKRTGVL
ncbi:MAG: hypothetical protein ABR500_00315 [Dermatophilaceae bacterium]|nr:hypothetical protein [Intrasporangiaceae bacterium]